VVEQPLTLWYVGQLNKTWNAVQM